MFLENILIIGALLLIISVVLSKASEKFGVPTLLIFLGVGMLAGSDGPGGIYFNDPHLAQTMGVVALIYILFAGGVDTDWDTIRPVLWQGVSLATLGVLISALLVGTFATLILQLTWLEGCLLGSIVASTDAAAVFSVLRSRNVSLRGRLRLARTSKISLPKHLLLTLLWCFANSCLTDITGNQSPEKAIPLLR